MAWYPKIILTHLAILIASFAFAQKPVVYYFSEVGLTLYTPSDFQVLDAAKNEALNEKGLKAIEEANDLSLDISQTKTLIAARKNATNYFNVTITPYNLKKDGPYDESSKAVSAILYKTFRDKMPDAKMDTTIGLKNIGGLAFTEFRLTIVINKKLIMNMILLSRYYKGYDLGISYLYTDDLTKNQIQKMLQSCKFNKQ